MRTAIITDSNSGITQSDSEKIRGVCASDALYDQ